MRLTRSKKAVLLGFTAGTLALVLASAAFACTIYQGKVTLRAAPLGSGSASAEGADGVHAYCSGDTRQDVNIVGSFTLEVEPATGCGGSQLDDGTYEVRWLNVAGDDVHAAAPDNCNPRTGGVPLGAIEVKNGSGAGSGTFAMPQPGGHPAVGYVNICVVPLDGTPESAPELFLNLI